MENACGENATVNDASDGRVTVGDYGIVIFVENGNDGDVLSIFLGSATASGFALDLKLITFKELTITAINRKIV